MRRKKALLALWAAWAAGWMFAASAGHAAEYWASPAGNDTAQGSKEEPFRTIQRAVKAAHPGDTVFVWAGRYEEHVSVTADKSGEPDKWLTVSAAQRGTTLSG